MLQYRDGIPPIVRYRRSRIPGGTYFFTVTLADRQSTLLVEQIAALQNAFRTTKAIAPFKVDAIVVLPEHLHAILTLPDDDADYPNRWRRIKGYFTSRVVTQNAHLVPGTNGEYKLWQRRYWEHTIRDEDDFAQHVDYIHFNPVKHGLVARVADWPYSSFHRMVRHGKLPLDWAGTATAEMQGYGERE
jgi:putative transposase